MSKVVGIVLAGVHHWDESALDLLRPRPLLPVAGRPLICAALEWLRAADIRRVVICANSASRAVRRVLGDGSALDLELHYYEDWSPRGPAGCVRDAAWELKAERLVVVEGTSWPAGEARPLLDAHVASGAVMTVVAAPEVQADLGDDGLLSPTGTYVLEQQLLAHIPSTGYQDIKEMLLPRLHQHDLPTAVHCTKPAGPRPLDVECYRALNAWALQRRMQQSSLTAGYRRQGECDIHATAQVASAARLLGPVLVGPRTRIEPGAVVVGPAVLGSGGVIASDAVVCTSVLWNDCRVASRALVDECVLADGAYVMPDSELRGLVIGGGAAGRQVSRAPVGRALRRRYHFGRRQVTANARSETSAVMAAAHPAGVPSA